MRVTSSRFIGRQRELAELDEALTEASDGRPSLAFVAGESGVGKTRLLNEFVDAAERRAARVIGGSSIELGEDELPYVPIVSALRPLAREDDAALADLPPGARAELARLLPELGESSPDDEGEPGAAQRRLFEAILAVVQRLGEEAPVLLWLEDIHWADRSTRSFLAFLAASLRDERALVLTSYRTDELHRRHPLRPLLAELERGPRVRRLELAPFERGELSAQLENLLGEPPADDLVERMFSRSEGNPLFTEELLAAGDSGRGLPPTLRDALLVRVESLPDAAQRALRVIATATRAGHELLAAVTGLSPDELGAALRDASAAHIVDTDSAGRYRFRHALLREVIYDDLLPGERSELHLTVAHALEAGAPGTNEVLLSTGIAHHYHMAGDQPQALRTAIAAATQADQVHAYGEGAGLLDRALELWSRVEDPEDLADADLAELLVRAGRSHGLAGDEERATALFERALDRLDEGVEPVRVASVLGELAASLWNLAQAERSRSTLRRALEILPAGDASPERARLLMLQLRFLLLQGRYSEVREAADEALRVADEAGLASARAGMLNRLGVALFALGDEEDGAGRLREAIELARRQGSSDDLASAYLNYADSLQQAGRSSEAAEIAAEASRVVDAGPRSMRWLELNSAEIAFDRGEWEVTQEYVDRQRSRAAGTTHAYGQLVAGKLALGRGELGAARPCLEAADAVLAGSIEPQFIAVAGALRAELERRRGDVAAARTAIDRAIDRIQYCSEDAAALALVSTAGIAVEADAAQRARDVDDAGAAGDAQTRAELHTERVRATVEAQPGRVEKGYLATAEAEFARACDDNDAELWAAAAAAWAAVERPYPEAIALWREAEAARAQGEASRAREAATKALAIARRLGSRWLVDEVEGLAARGRLALGSEGEEAPKPSADEDDGRPDDPFGLTDRERQVLELVAAGATNREIGAELYMAEKTASVHVSRILTKLDVRSRTEAAAVAHRLGLVSTR